MKELQEKIKGLKQNDPRLKRVAEGTVASDEGGQSLRWLLAIADSDAFSVCSLPRDHYLAGFPSGDFPVVARPFGRRSVPHPGIFDGRHDDRSAVDYTGSFGGSLATENDGHRNAALHALRLVGCAVRLTALLVGRKYRGV